jgi:hypothetical protein
MMPNTTLSSEHCHLCLQHELCLRKTAFVPASCFIVVGKSSHSHHMLENCEGLQINIPSLLTAADKGESIGTGWTFTPPEVQPMMQALDLALQTYKEYPESWQKLMRSGMQQDLSWDRSAQQYEQIFQWAMMDPPVRPG